MSTVFNPTIAAITLRGLLGRRRSLLIALPPALLLALSIGLRLTTDINSSHDFGWPGVVLGQIGLVTLLPLTAMIIGTSVLGTEVDDSSILHLLATPVSRATVMTTKWIVASAATLVFAVVPLGVAAFVATSGYVDSPGPLDMTFTPVKGDATEAVGVVVAAAVGALVYSAFFLFLSVVTKRSVAVTLIYILVWESLLTRQVSGLRLLSIGQYELGLADHIGHLPNLDAHLTMGTSVVMSAAFTLFALVYGTRRLRSFRVSGEAA
ncbi:ABC transporter permease subunit [Catenulispora subtropica]|uniref:ABC-2 type transport system permease protein n=1 Tax=Catenulispora subtropica TaxID=450798 RepID=A0ABP5CE40_9ACTN